mmetsp:Transcript_36595/g.84875  ORF Transcript_36595/g.84875 Transcript_36595/m.84875 type:complete len:207 (-) Transcript_36595:247-867(-)
MALVAPAAEGVGAVAGGDALDELRRLGRHIPDLDKAVTGQCDEQELVVRRQEDVGRQLAHRLLPAHGLRRQVDGQQLAAVLQAGVGHRALAVDVQMAGRLGRRDLLDELQRLLRVAALPAVQAHIVQPVGGGDEPLHVRREAQVVGVGDAAHHALHLGRARVQQGQRVAERVRDDQALLVGRQVEVMRLLAGRDALDDLEAHRVDH